MKDWEYTPWMAELTVGDINPSQPSYPGKLPGDTTVLRCLLQTVGPSGQEPGGQAYLPDRTSFGTRVPVR
ncbi:hypothetical protein BO70DRAFT_95058 [Aspergillus heteromorphus CBS 117.55]|uniref:Uncharacterized protein n=1 Tax=Aspergillus heteromorphus CBS 117.55 TaxID=1448321 RepID=A0A317VR28_9EURO|nr:uncharacterized protein BO70DRAFT_95058 [Aspergillus heteromorphus CBS 117.55]PWY75358.1 hypothetical protein BO70DRAFT_95058 [Aspergillus heteromorphus CBS 117.55]